MKDNIKKVFQVAVVFIGTIVGAGLASGQEITQFFTSYGFNGFKGILICLIFYITICPLVAKISMDKGLSSYGDISKEVSPGFLGLVTEYTTNFFFVASSAIILAGSGALIHQYLGISKYIGMLIMIVLTVYTLLKDTKGLIFINSFIVPCLSITIVAIFILYILAFGKYINFNAISQLKPVKPMLTPIQWIISAVLYASFNITSCSGVLVPLTKEMKSRKAMYIGIIVGSVGLVALSLMINLMLGINIPNIFKYEIPLLYIASPFGFIVQTVLLIIIFCEMFSTEVSDIYSLAKTLEQKYNIKYKKGIFLVMLVTIPLSQIGFKNLINILYPAFGTLSVIFIVQCALYSFRHRKK
ncbi:Uncharacterized membrane protein YkvI [Hathewaya proteolytica DSM 3090]|uniref:Uncharacterized membrane protein YkvI n=1 Tax=Hathewaya proteolytica DSM 3090 TaxID=1121331 RepID=A0A1M6MES7_9CLOT|nr:transporter [Hathewaya proteolytica]SHJ81964.1 Uncharacterized membrane protein YkvI [Hathewaya proteolytica DSM 3090]